MARLSGRRIRVGVLLDSLTVPNWIFSVLQDIRNLPECELALILSNGSSPQRPTVGERLKTFRLQAFALYSRLDCLAFGRSGGEDAFAQKDATELVGNIPQFVVVPRKSRFVDRFEDSDVQKIKAGDLDVLVRLGFRILKGEILNAARYGVWSYHHGDNDHYRGGPALFWEIYENNPVSGTVLQVLNEQLDGGAVICKSFASTFPYSLWRNRNQTYWKTAKFVVRKLRDLAQTGPDALKPIQPAADQQPRIYKSPTVPQLAKYLGLVGVRCAKAQFDYRLDYEQWYVAVADCEAQGSPLPNHGMFRAIESPANRFFADPCVIEKEGVNYVFFEDYSFQQKRGRISMAEVRDGAVGPVQPVLEEPFHLAYPMVYEISGAVYMIPETSATKNIRIYRAHDFPRSWIFERVLAEIDCVDPTLHFDGELFWIFANVAEPGASRQDELCLYYARSLTGHWSPHPRNPVVSDVCRARPAGKLFRRNGELFRPAQNSGGRYGRGIVIHQVDVLTQTEYREHIVQQISSDWAPAGDCTHTLNLSNSLLVTDGMRYVSKLRRRFKPIPGGCLPGIRR